MFLTLIFSYKIIPVHKYVSLFHMRLKILTAQTK